MRIKVSETHTRTLLSSSKKDGKSALCDSLYKEQK